MSFSIVALRSTRTGRMSVLSPTPLFFLCKDIVKMPRLRALKSANLEALNLGAHGQAPQLLKDLLDNCPLLDSLNLYKCYCTAPAFGIHQGRKAVVEHLLVEMRPNLANICIQAASAGLKKMAQGLTALRSLHLMPGPNKESDLTSTALRTAFQPPPPTCPTHRRGGGGHGLGRGGSAAAWMGFRSLETG